MHILELLTNFFISADLTKGQKECLVGDETAGYCVSLFKPCGCKNQSIYDHLLISGFSGRISGLGACQEEPSVTKFICVPGYEKCLNNNGPEWCLPSFVKKRDECEDDIWNKLQEKFGSLDKFTYAPAPVMPCFDSEDPTPYNPNCDEPAGDDSIWNM